MKKSITFYIVLFAIAVISNSSSCGGDDPKINYDYGFFTSDTVLNLTGMNSEYDDFNMALPEITMELPIIFSSNRNSSGTEFDIVSGAFGYRFNQIDGSYELSSDMIDNPFYSSITSEVNTDGNEFGPLRLFNGLDGMEYLFYAGESESGDLDLKYMKYFPTGGLNPPLELNVQEANVVNSQSNDAYITFDWDYEKAYFTSDRDGDYDILETDVTITTTFSDWLDGEMGTASSLANINSAADDKCPYVYDTIMVFTSDRSGGMGGFDLYYSTYSSGQWSNAFNMGPSINTEYNEYRPLISNAPGFTNKFLLFSSDRPGGLGGYDLYLTGVDDEDLEK